MLSGTVKENGLSATFFFVSKGNVGLSSFKLRKESFFFRNTVVSGLQLEAD